MKLKKCPEKHFYDADKYNECPHCIKKAMKQAAEKWDDRAYNKNMGLSQIARQASSKTVYLPETEYAMGRQAEMPQRTGNFNVQNDSPRTVYLPDPDSVMINPSETPQRMGNFNIPNDSPRTVYLSEPDSVMINPSETPQRTGNFNVPNDSPRTVYLPESDSVMINPSEMQQETENFNVPPLTNENFSVQENNQQEMVSDFAREVAEKNTSVQSYAMQNSGTKTVAFYNTGRIEPVVGWLVCVKGEYVGESFNLKEGQNFIGRSLGMDVALVNEKSVSREFHAGIIFDPVEKVFYAVPGHSNGLTYVNGSILFSAVQLKAYDEIQLGKSLYVFMPFCGDSFSWDKYSGQ